MIGRRSICIGLLSGLALGVAGCDLKAGTASPDWAENPTRSNKGEVMFRLTPDGVVDGHFRIEVRVDTHSGDLTDLNLQEAATLRVGETIHRPISPVKLGGHHAGGTLVFELNEVPPTFEVVIKAVRGMGELTFRWP